MHCFDEIDPPRLDRPSRQKVLDYFECAWASYEWLFSGLTHSAEVLRLQPHPFRNALAFYYGHTAAFYIQKLRLAGVVQHSVDAQLDQVLERGVWPLSADDIRDRQRWPDAERLGLYRRKVQSVVLEAIEQLDFDQPAAPDDPLWALMMAIEHDYIHFQTTISLIRRVPVDWITRPEDWEYGPFSGGRPDTSWVDVPGGSVEHGREPGDDRWFGWDNEYGVIRSEVPAFEMRRQPVTNREMLQFVEDGGYERPELWCTGEAGAWLEEMAPRQPAAWIRTDGSFRYRAVFDEMDMPWDWPVLVNRHEAAAYAWWAAASLPTEAQYQRVLDIDRFERERVLSRTNCNVAMRWGSPVPVGSLDRAIGPSDIELLGNVAFWAREDFAPLSAEEFRPNRFYRDFSEPWFRGDHGVLLGAGFCALGHLCQIGWMRDFMQNHMDQVAGIMLVKGA